MNAYFVLVGITIIAYCILEAKYYKSKKEIQLEVEETNSHLVDNISQRKIQELTICVFFICYMILLSLRDINTGVDTYGYVHDYFLDFKNYTWKSILYFKSDERAFSFMTMIIGKIIDSPSIYLTIIAIVSICPIMFLYRNESDDALLCCSFFMISLLFELFFSGLRQGVAIGLIVPAYFFAKRKKIILFGLFVLLASSFHKSALIALLLYPIYNFKIKTKIYLFITLVIMFFVYRYNDLIFSYLLEYSGEKYNRKYSYLLAETTNQYGLLKLFSIFVLYSFFVLDENKADANTIGLRNILIFATFLQTFAPIHFVASRMNYYFILFIPLALTKINQKCKKQLFPITKLFSIVMTIYFFYYFFMKKGDSLQIMDYKFFFDF